MIPRPCVKMGSFLPPAPRLSLTALWECSHPVFTVRRKASQSVLNKCGDLLVLLFSHPCISCFICCRSSKDNPGLVTALVFTCPTPASSLTHSLDSGLSFQGNHKILCLSFRFIIEVHIASRITSGRDLRFSKSPVLPGPCRL